MIDEAKTRFVCTEQPAVGSSTRFLMPHAEKMARGIEDVHIGERPSVGRVEFQIVSINGASRLPAETYFVYLRRGDLCKIEAGLNREFREAGIVLDQFLGRRASNASSPTEGIRSSSSRPPTSRK